METKKISELTEVTSPTSTDVFTIVNDGETKKVQLTNVKTVLGVTQAETDIDGLDTRLTTAEGEIDTAQSDINNAEAVIGNETDTYSTSSTYALGDLVIYNSLLYKCTTAITVAEAWNSAKWTQIDLVNVSNELKGTILYENSTGSNANVTLSSDSYANYKRFEIEAKTYDNHYKNFQLYYGANKIFELDFQRYIFSFETSYIQFVNNVYTINDNTIAVTNHLLQNINLTSKTINDLDISENFIYITKITGYK